MTDDAPVAVLRSWLESVERLDVDACVDLFAEDALMLIPYAPEGLPLRVEGREQIAQTLALLGLMFREFQFADVELHATDDPELAVATARSEIVLTNGEDYRQDYAFFVRARDGRIVEYREFFDPIRAQAALALAGSGASSP